jgi:predicted glycosyltransferase
MKIMVDLGHPAHVHLFKNFIWEMEKRGHEVLITDRDKEILLDLLNAYGFEYITISKEGKNLSGLAIELLKRDYKLFNIARSYKPDLLIGLLSENLAHIGKLLRIPSVMFTDTEHAKLANMLTLPFTDVILTPSCYKKDLGKKQIRYNGYHELAYLHPNYFTPNPAVLDEIGLSKDDTFIILRFVSWSASHDVGQHGIKNKIELVRELERYGQVFITSEGGLPKELEKYKIKVSPEKLHDLLYYASLYVGESPTIATESAILGVPAVLVSSWAYKAGNMEELCDKKERTY